LKALRTPSLATNYYSEDNSQREAGLLPSSIQTVTSHLPPIAKQNTTALSAKVPRTVQRKFRRMKLDRRLSPVAKINSKWTKGN
jgi:hypothetical protein